MRTKKKSSGKIPEKKSAVPYKSAAPHRHKPSRPLQTVKLPKSQMPSRQTEEHQALLRTKYHKKRQSAYTHEILRFTEGTFASSKDLSVTGMGFKSSRIKYLAPIL